jgi:hypothetical protein
MRAALATLLLVLSFDTFAATIERLYPSSIEANSGEWALTIYGTELTGQPVVYSSAAGEFAVEIFGEGEEKDYVSVMVPLEVLEKPGQVKVSIGDASAILTVTPPPYQPLQVQGGDPIVVAAEGRWGAKVEYDIHAIGGQDPEPTITCDPPSGSVFPLGPSYVRCVAENKFGERAEGGRYIYVADYGVPFVQVPERIRVEATSREGARVEFTATASDTIDGDLPVTCEPPSGSLFPVGETVVQCVATDSSLNEGHGEFVVEVVGEKETLLLRLPESITAEATGPEGAEVTFEVTAYGTSDPEPKVECDPKSGSTFPFGETTVQCVAEDSFGNRAEGSFTVTVGDTVAPLITTIFATPDKLEPNGKWVEIKIEVEALDVVDPMPRCRVVDVTTNQPGGGAEITGELTVELLAERDVKIGDRRYDIRVECTDASENKSEAVANVIVPKGKVDESSPSNIPATKEFRRMRW